MNYKDFKKSQNADINEAFDRLIESAWVIGDHEDYVKSMGFLQKPTGIKSDYTAYGIGDPRGSSMNHMQSHFIKHHFDIKKKTERMFRLEKGEHTVALFHDPVKQETQIAFFKHTRMSESHLEGTNELVKTYRNMTPGEPGYSPSSATPKDSREGEVTPQIAPKQSFNSYRRKVSEGGVGPDYFDMARGGAYPASFSSDPSLGEEDDDPEDDKYKGNIPKKAIK